MSKDSTSYSEWFSANRLQWARLWLLIGALIITSIFYLSLTSRQLPIPHVSHSDKIMHLLAYLVLMGWFIQIFHHRMGRVLFAVGFIGMGIMIEFLQAMHPMRHFDVLDMLANFSGVTLAWLAGFTQLDSLLLWFERHFLPEPA